MKNVVDSSGWLEFFTDGENAGFFAPVIEDVDNLLVPVICLYEVFKRVCQLRDVHTAQILISDMLNGEVIIINEAIALSAVILSLDLNLAMADSLILASARSHDAVLWTQDVHFQKIPGVKWIMKGSRASGDIIKNHKN